MADDYPKGDGIVRWASTDWLEKNLDSDKFMILDTQPNAHDYIEEHIPGAIYLNSDIFRVPKNGVPAQYISEVSAEQAFRRIGLRNDFPVVVYTGKGPFKGWGDGLEQTMMAYTLARFGHENVWVLDGGIDKWKKENRKLTKEYTRIDETNFNVKLHNEFYVEYDEFKNMKDRDDVILLDARPPKFYEGQGPWMKPGHIPGAINLPWANLMSEDNPALLKSENELEAIITKKNITKDKTIICSCGTGREATNEYILFKWFLNYPNVRIYEGSFTEWVSYPENPVVTGPSPR